MPYGLKARAFARAFVCVSVFGLALAAAAQPASAHGRRPAASRAHRRLAASITPAPPFQLPGGTDNAPHDVDCLTDAVYYEARGESPAGQAAVAQVVLNRVRHPAFPKTICGVVFQGVHSARGCQFSFVCNGAMNRPLEADAWRRAQDIATHALTGGVMAAVGDATNFHAVRAGVSFGRGLTQVARIGLQVFFRLSGYAGDADLFSAQPQLSLDEAKPARAEIHPTGAPVLASAPTPPVKIDATPAAASAKDPVPKAAALSG